MSRMPGLQFPTANNGQPQTRAQQRPGVNLLQRLFAMKASKLDRQGQDFQEESFNKAKEGFDDSLGIYNKDKSAWDEQEARRYKEAKSIYDTQLDDYNTLKGNYDSQLADYQTAVDDNSSQAAFQNKLLGIRSNRTDYQLHGGGNYGDYYTNTKTGEVLREGTPEFQAVSLSVDNVKNLAPITTQVPSTTPSFDATPPTFDFMTTPFASDVPSFNYEAPESPFAKNTSKMSSLSNLTAQLRGALPENTRNRNKSSIYQLF